MPKGRLLLFLFSLFAIPSVLTAAPAEAQQGTSIANTVLISEAGQPVRLSDYRGKVVFINFWGSWCSPCLQEMDSIRTLQAQLGDRRNDVAFVFVSAKSRYHPNDSAWLRQHGISGASYRTASDADSRYVPMTYVLDPSGAVAQFKSSAVDWGMHANEIRSLLNGGSHRVTG